MISAMLELRHLRALVLLNECGTLSVTAERLHLTPSALSHQLKVMETHYGPIFLRKSRPLRFTPAGERLLHLASRVLGEVRQAEHDITALTHGNTGRLNIAIECHSCFEWLMPGINAFREQWPAVEIDLSAGFNFDSLPALARGDVDLVITSDVKKTTGVSFTPLFHYQALLVMAPDHPLISRAWIRPSDLAGETLITYPVPRQRLDIFKRFLHPAGIKPAAQRTTELTLMMVQLVASGRGVAALPNWVAADYLKHHYVAARPLGRQGLWGTLYCALRSGQKSMPYMQGFIDTAREVSFRTLNGIQQAR